MIPQLNRQQLQTARRLLNARNPFEGTVGSIYYGGTYGQSANAKHNLYFDFGYPSPDELSFQFFYQLYRRNGFAAALVNKTASKTWQTHPVLTTDGDAVDHENATEEAVRRHFAKMRFWQALQEADRRSMVGKYAGVILQLGDGMAYNEPVTRVPGGITGLVSVLPAWEEQLTPSEWDTDPRSPTYGKPLMFLFSESSVDPEQGKVRSFPVHPDRVLIWSKDGTTWGESKLEPCYNALMDIDKIRGSGGEGFWKNAKSQPVLTASPDVDFNQLATMLGTDLEGIADALDEVVTKWTKGFDESLMLQGMTASTLAVSLPAPAEFFNVALQEVAASWPIPQKTLVGMQTGERASTEDAREWAQTNMSRRANYVEPNIMELVERFVAWGIFPAEDWAIYWEDLTAPTLEEKLAISERMAKVNQAMFATGDAVFTDDEIREVAGYAPTDLGDGLPDDVDPEPIEEPGDAEAA